MALSVFAAAEDAPDRTAVITGRESLTYAQLADRVRLRTDDLAERGLAGDEAVGIVARNDLPTFEMLHALIALGTPALLLHPRLTDVERGRPAQEAGAVAVLEPGGPRARADGDRNRARGSLAGRGPVPPPPDERTMAIVHTSGTSGRMKGVVLSRRAFVASAAASAANMGWREDDRWLLTLPLAHVGGFSILVRCLLARRTVVLGESTAAAKVVEAMRRHDVTLASLVPTLLKRILDLDPAVDPPHRLRAILLGGAAASPALLSRAADSGWPVLTTYGMSEACSQITTQRYGTVNRGEAGSGPPLHGVEVRLGDDDGILVRGPTLFSGYVPPSEADPFLDDGWFPTGDRGRFDDDGNLHVLGRRADRIVTGGENVDPVEVERALESLPGIREACVFGRPDEEWGEVVCAAVVVEEREPMAALREQIEGLRQRLAPFKVPKRMAAVTSLPRNRTGKVDRRAAAEHAADHLRPV